MTHQEALLRQYAPELAAALENAVGTLLACVVPAGGCDDAAAIAYAIERGEAALAAAGRLMVREADHSTDAGQEAAA